MKKIFYFTAILIMTFHLMSQGQSPFTKMYYNRNLINGIQVSSSVKSPADSSFMLAGTADLQGMVMKLTKEGEISFSKMIDFGGLQFQADRIIKTTDNNFIISGVNEGGAVLCKIDQNGDTLWTKYFPDGSMTDIYESYDGSLILLKNIPDVNPQNKLIQVCKLTAAGDPVWARNLSAGAGTQNYLGAVAEGADHSLMVYGYFVENNVRSAVLFRINLTGEMLWAKKIVTTPTSSSYGFDIKTSETGFLLLTSHIGQYSYGSVIKIDTAANVVWAHSYNPLSGLSGIPPARLEPMLNGDYAFCEQNFFGNIFRISATGSLLWVQIPKIITRNVIASYDDGLLIYGNGPVIMVGDDESLGPQIGILKTDADGNTTSCVEPNSLLDLSLTVELQGITPSFSNVTVNAFIGHPVITVLNDSILADCIQVIGAINESEDHTSLLITPNPVNTTAVISLEGNAPKCDMKAEMFDLSGRIIWQENFYSQQITFNRTGIPAGTYLMKISDESGKIYSSGRIILM